MNFQEELKVRQQQIQKMTAVKAHHGQKVEDAEREIREHQLSAQRQEQQRTQKVHRHAAEGDPHVGTGRGDRVRLDQHIEQAKGHHADRHMKTAHHQKMTRFVQRRGDQTADHAVFTVEQEDGGDRRDDLVADNEPCSTESKAHRTSM